MNKILRYFLLIIITTIFFGPVFSQDLHDSCISGNCINGYGTYIDSAGTKYTGNFKFGMKDGKGKQEWPNGTVYEGDWVLDHMLGKGIIRFPGGEIYEGDVFGGKKNGKGKIRWPGGASYEGDWVENRMEGKGIIRYPEGTWYVGTLRNSKREGTGTYYGSDSTVLYTGPWENDEQKAAESEKTIKILPPTFCVAFKTLLKDLDNNLKNYLGEKEEQPGKNERESYFVPKYQLPDALYNTIHSSQFANTYMAHLGEYKTLEEAELRMQSKMQEIRKCLNLREYYLLESEALSSSSKDLKRYIAGKKNPDGFESARMHLSISKDEEIYNVVLYMFGGKTTRYYNIAKDTINKTDEKLAASLQAIMNSSKNNFIEHLPDSIHKHESIKADIPSALGMPGATNCRIITKTEIKYKGHTCSMYLGKNEALARQKYKELFKKLSKILGPEYVYNTADFWKASIVNIEFNRFNHHGSKVKIALYTVPGGTWEVALMVYEE